MDDINNKQRNTLLPQKTQPNETQKYTNAKMEQKQSRGLRLGRDYNQNNDEAKQKLRLARSNSIKEKLNLENTRLKINIDNLSSLVANSQNSEAKYQLEIDRYKEKITKYKDKIKQKDGIIAKLIDKFEKKVNHFSVNVQNQVHRLHDSYLKGFNNKIKRDEQLGVGQVLQRYQELFKKYSLQSKERKYLQQEKSDLQKTILELKESFQKLQFSKSDKQKSRQIQYLKLKLNDANQIIEKQQRVRNQLLGNLRRFNTPIIPQINATIQEIERTKTQFERLDRAAADAKVNEFSEIRSKLYESQTNLMKEKESRKATERHCDSIEDQLNTLSQQINTSNTNLQSLQNRITQIQKTYSFQVQKLQQKTQILFQESNNIEQYKQHIEEASRKLNDAVRRFGQESQQWTRLQKQYQTKIDGLRSAKTILQDLLQKERQKRKIFELKLISEDEEAPLQNLELGQSSVKQKYLDERLENLKKQSGRARKQNEQLSQQLNRNHRAYEMLEGQLKYAENRIFQLEQALRSNNTASSTAISKNQKSRVPLQYDPLTLMMEINKEKVEKQVENLSKQELKEKIVQLSLNLHHLENQVSQLRSKNIDLHLANDELDKKIQEKNKSDKNLSNRNSINSKTFDENGQDRGVFKKGEPFVEDAQYKINILSANQIPENIKNMSFQELSSVYIASKQQNLQLKDKIQQLSKQNTCIKTQNQNQNQGQSQQGPNRIYQTNLSTILSQNENDPSDGNSQQVDDNFYRNINQQMDRLTSKNKELEREKYILKKQFQQQKIKYEEHIENLKQKYDQTQQTNKNLSNIVVQLEERLSQYQNNEQNNSMQQLRGSDRGTDIRNDHDLLADIDIQIMQKKKQFQDLLKTSQEEVQTKQNQNELRILESQIRFLQQQKNEQIKLRQQSRGSIASNDHQCQNCQTLSKLNSDLIKKVGKLESSINDKKSALLKEIQKLENSSQNMTQEQRKAENKKLKQVLTELKTELTFENNQKLQLEKQLNNLKQINQQLVESLHEKQKAMLKLKTDLHRHNYERSGYGQESAKKFQDIFEAYEKKIDQLESQLKQRNQTSVSDLYDTINYLNIECETLKKQIQSSQKQKNGENADRPNTGKKVTFHDDNIMNNNDEGVGRILRQYNFESLQSLISALEQQKQINIEIMRQNNKLQNKIYQMNIKSQQYFKKLNEGKIYEVIQDKQKQIEETNKLNVNLEQKLENLNKDREILFQQNDKINQDLKSIQEKIERLTGQKLSITQSTFNIKSFDKSNTGISSIKEENNERRLTPQQSQYILQSLIKKVASLKNTIQSTTHKSRPNFDIRSIQQVPDIQEVVIILVDRLHYAWNLVQQRTNQFNSLTDQMNLISMECMKNQQFEKSCQSQARKHADLIEQRYEQVITELVEYENQNRRLEKEVNRLREQVNNYKKQIQQIQSKYILELRSESSEEQLPYNQIYLNKLLESGSSYGQIPSLSDKNANIPEILRLFLGRIKELQGNLESIGNQFESKNRNFDFLIQKQKSFISQKSKVKQYDEQSLSINNRRHLQTKTSRDRVNYNDQRNVDQNRILHQIEDLMKINQNLRNKGDRYKSMLYELSQTIVGIFDDPQNNINNQKRQQIEEHLYRINKEMQSEDQQNQVNIQDGDGILSSSFINRMRNSGKISRHGLEEVKRTLQQAKISQSPIKKERQQRQQANKMMQNMHLIEENNALVEEMLLRLQQSQKIQGQIQNMKRKIASTLTRQQLYNIINLQNKDEMLNGFQDALLRPSLNQVGDMRNSNQVSMEEGEWVESYQIEQIINSIYPVKTNLCLIVQNSIKTILSASKKEVVLQTVEFSFKNLKRKQQQISQQLRKRDDNVTQYGNKVKKLLQSKYSEDDSNEKLQILNDNSFRRTTQFRSEYDIKKQLERERLNQSSSKSQSGIFEY